MKKNLIAGIMIASAAIFGTSASFAQAPQKDGNKECGKTEKCDAKAEKCHKGAFNPFEGLNLTAEQQTKINELKSECKAKKAEFKKEARSKKEQAKKDAKECRNNMKSEMLKKVKAILTPEQYVQFLENAFINNGDGHNKQGMRPGGKHHGDKAGNACKSDKAGKACKGEKKSK